MPCPISSLDGTILYGSPPEVCKLIAWFICSSVYSVPYFNPYIFVSPPLSFKYGLVLNTGAPLASTGEISFNVNIVENSSILTILITNFFTSSTLLAGVIITAKFDDIIKPSTSCIFNKFFNTSLFAISTKRKTLSLLFEL